MQKETNVISLQLHNLICIHNDMNIDISFSLSFPFPNTKEGRVPRKIWKFVVVTHIYHAPARLFLYKAESLISWTFAKKEKNEGLFQYSSLNFLCYNNMDYSFTRIFI